eukprot:IDg3410t1
MSTHGYPGGIPPLFPISLPNGHNTPNIVGEINVNANINNAGAPSSTTPNNDAKHTTITQSVHIPIWDPTHALNSSTCREQFLPRSQEHRAMRTPINKYSPHAAVPNRKPGWVGLDTSAENIPKHVLPNINVLPMMPLPDVLPESMKPNARSDSSTSLYTLPTMKPMGSIQRKRGSRRLGVNSNIGRLNEKVQPRVPCATMDVEESTLVG